MTPVPDAPVLPVAGKGLNAEVGQAQQPRASHEDPEAQVATDAGFADP